MADDQYRDRYLTEQPASRTRFYRDKRNGKVMGVCAGIADYTGFDVSLVRVCFLAAVFMSVRPSAQTLSRPRRSGVCGSTTPIRSAPTR